jgi:hypothetical protein
MKNVHFRGVIWPRGSIEGLHRYAVIGILVTDEPIPEFDGKNEIVLDGNALGIEDILGSIRQHTPKFRLGDANMVLTNLQDVIDTDNEPVEPKPWEYPELQTEPKPKSRGKKKKK